MTRIVTVLQTRALNALQRGSSEFTAKHVKALYAQCQEWSNGVEFQCLTDAGKIGGIDCIPLKRNWPGWWSKLEMFDPELPGDFLFVDLDTVITGPLTDILAVNKLTLLRDFYRDGKKLKEGLGGGLIYLPHKARQPVWDDFISNPTLAMRLYSRGDQFLFEQHYLNTAARWQDEVPGQVVSWKVNCQHGVPPDARVVCFHGQPRPWAVGQFLHLYR